MSTAPNWWVLVFALACAASSLYGWLAGMWPFGVVEGIWALVALVALGRWPRGRPPPAAASLIAHQDASRRPKEQP